MRVWVWVASGREEDADGDADLCEEKDAGRRKYSGIAVGEGMVRELGLVAVSWSLRMESLRVRVWSGVEGRMLGEIFSCSCNVAEVCVWSCLRTGLVSCPGVRLDGCMCISGRSPKKDLA